MSADVYCFACARRRHMIANGDVSSTGKIRRWSLGWVHARWCAYLTSRLSA